MHISDELPLDPSAVVCLVDCRVDIERLRAFFADPSPGSWPRVLVLIYSDPALCDAYREFEAEQESGQLKLWPVGQWQQLFEQEVSRLRSAVATCQQVLGPADSPVLIQLKEALKLRAQSFVQEILAAGKELITYYQSDMFLERLKAIAAGAKPRILVDQACSSVAVKRYSRNVAATFKALGYTCVIHPNCRADERDVMGACILDARNYKPDLIIASPNNADRHDFMPTQIQVPVVLSLQDSDPHMVFPVRVRHRPLGRLDMVYIMKERFYGAILDAGLRPAQLHFELLPVEARRKELSPKLRYDVGFIKTMSPQRGLRAIIEEARHEPVGKQEATQIAAAEAEIERQLKRGQLGDMQSIRNLSGPYTWDTELVHYAHVAFCEYYIRQIAQAGHSLSLCGGNWERISDLAAFARGHVESRADYQQQFLDCRINLSLNPWVEYHPRILDGGACAAFFLVYRVPEEAAWDRLPTNLKPGVHFDTFETPQELEEKLNYYLEHPESRQRIGRALQEQVIAQCSYESHCQRMIERFTHLVREELNP